jgi:hypothetical protein
VERVPDRGYGRRRLSPRRLCNDGSGVTIRSRPWLVLALALTLVAAVFVGVWLWPSRQPVDTAALLQRLPPTDAAVLNINFAQLRQAGILDMITGSRVAREPEYEEFVRKTGFDYQRDLDHAVVAFGKDATYLLLSGRFDWKQLQQYAENSGGTCHNTFCRLPGSTPERKISFFPVGARTMAMGISRDDHAASAMLKGQPGSPSFDAPDEPVWLRVTGSRLQSVEELPPGTRLFVKSMEDAEEVFLSFGHDGDHLQAEVRVRSRSEEDAAVLAEQLRQVTDYLRKVIYSQKLQPTNRDLSGVLTAGVFRREGNTVHGRWPLHREFLESLADGTALSSE